MHFKVPSRRGLAFPEFQEQKKHSQGEGFNCLPSPFLPPGKPNQGRWVPTSTSCFFSFPSGIEERLGKERLRSFFGKSVSYDWERPSPGSSQLAWNSAHPKAIDPGEESFFSSRAGERKLHTQVLRRGPYQRLRGRVEKREIETDQAPGLPPERLLNCVSTTSRTVPRLMEPARGLLPITARLPPTAGQWRRAFLGRGRNRLLSPCLCSVWAGVGGGSYLGRTWFALVLGGLLCRLLLCFVCASFCFALRRSSRVGAVRLEGGSAVPPGQRASAPAWAAGVRSAGKGIRRGDAGVPGRPLGPDEREVEEWVGRQQCDAPGRGAAQRRIRAALPAAPHRAQPAAARRRRQQQGAPGLLQRRGARAHPGPRIRGRLLRPQPGRRRQGKERPAGATKAGGWRLSPLPPPLAPRALAALPPWRPLGPPWRRGCPRAGPAGWPVGLRAQDSAPSPRACRLWNGKPLEGSVAKLGPQD